MYRRIYRSQGVVGERGKKQRRSTLWVNIRCVFDYDRRGSVTPVWYVLHRCVFDYVFAPMFFDVFRRFDVSVSMRIGESSYRFVFVSIWQCVFRIWQMWYVSVSITGWYLRINYRLILRGQLQVDPFHQLARA